MEQESCSTEQRLGPYVLFETLGYGTFGKVKKGKCDSEKTVAVKILEMKKLKLHNVVNKVRREVQLLSKLKHPNIAKLYQVYSTPNDLFLVMEFVPGGELFEYIVEKGKLDNDESRRFFQQLISAVDYCHQRGVVHRDLKPENVLLNADRTVLKVVDFGLCNVLADGVLLSTSCGSPNYAAPEVIAGKLYAGPEVDLWSCGVILYTMLTGRLPFEEDSLPRLFRRIRAGVFFKPDFLDPTAMDLISHLLQVRPLDRANVKELLQNPWFSVECPAYLFPPLDDQLLNRSLLLPDLVSQLAEKYNITDSEARDKLSDPTDPCDPIKLSYRLLKSQQESDAGYGSSRSSDSSIASSLSNLSLSTPTRCPANRTCIKPEDKFCSPDCNLCPNLGATECLFGKKLPSLETCDACDKYGQTGCVFSEDPAGIIEDLTKSIPIKKRRHTVDVTPSLDKAVVSIHKGSAKNKWHLGIRSRSRPRDVMKEVYRSLLDLDLEWTRLDPFHLIVRPKESEKQLNTQVRISLQLYQADSQNFLIDFTDATRKTIFCIFYCPDLERGSYF